MLVWSDFLRLKTCGFLSDLIEVRMEACTEFQPPDLDTDDS